jgi:hypothetical protein
MYLCIGAAVSGLLAYAICIGKGKKKEYGTYFLVWMAAGIFGILVCLSDEDTQWVDGAVERPEPGEGSVSEDFQLSVDDLQISEPYQVIVENRHLTKTELDELFTEAIQELEQTFLGENETLDEICQPVVLPETLLDGQVDVSWSFDDYRAVNLSGELLEENLTEEGTLVNVQTVLDYEGAQAEHSFSMMVYPPKKTAQEQFFTALAQELDEQNEGSGTAFSLPRMVAGHVLQWEKKQPNKQYLVLLFGLIAMAAIAIGKREDLRKARQQRNSLLLAEYPQMLSQMALLLGAGMTVSMAWERIVLGYESREGNQQAMPVYEEMGITYRQIKDGIGERLAYEQFGERLQLPVYRRFSTLLAQNLRKGTVGLSALLEKEMQEAYDARESNAKKRGEELQTKLLLPMMLMLGLVIVIIMIPAVASFSV